MTKLTILAVIGDLFISMTLYYIDLDNAQVDWASYAAQGDAVADGVRDYNGLAGPCGQSFYYAGYSYFQGLLSHLGLFASFKKCQLLHIFLHAISTYTLVNIAEKCLKNNQRLLQLAVAFYLLQFRERYFSVQMLQNDMLMTLALQAAVLLLLNDQVLLSMLFLNLSFSVKIGGVLWLPGLLLVMSKKRSILSVIGFFVFTVVFQYVIALEFIKANAAAYAGVVFSTRRLALRYTVLYFLMPEETFMSREFGIFATALLLGFNLLFLVCKWTTPRTFFKDVGVWPISLKLQQVNDLEAIRIIYTCVLIAATFSHQQHPQFYEWYSPSYPLLVAILDIPLALKFVITIAIEYGTLDPFSYNSFQEIKYVTAIIHLLLVLLLWRNQVDRSLLQPASKAKQN